MYWVLTLKFIGKLSEIEKSMNWFPESNFLWAYTLKVYETAYTVVVSKVFWCKWQLEKVQFR